MTALDHFAQGRVGGVDQGASPDTPTVPDGLADLERDVDLLRSMS